MHLGRVAALAASLAVVLAAPVLAAPGVADAQLLGRASSAARGDSDSGSSRQRDDDSDRDRRDDRESSGGVVSSASRAARGSSGGGGGWGSPGGGRSWGRGRGWGVSSAAAALCPLGVPYASPGYHAQDDAGSYAAEPVRVAGRLELELGYALGGAGRLGFAARLQLPILLDLTTRYSIFVEPTDGGILAAALGRFGADIRIVDDRWVQIRVGGALRHFHDDVGGVFGGDVSIGLDAFPVDPLVVSGELSAGMVGEAVVVQARGTLGLIVESVEIFAGYDYEALFAGSVQVDLGGPMLGVRGWL